MPRSSVFGRLSSILVKTAGRHTVAYHCDVRVRLSSRMTVATWPLIPKKEATIFRPTLLYRFIFVGLSSSENTHTEGCCFFFWVVLVQPGFVACYGVRDTF